MSFLGLLPKFVIIKVFQLAMFSLAELSLGDSARKVKISEHFLRTVDNRCEPEIID